jgi:NADPH:quinone reductase
MTLPVRQRAVEIAFAGGPEALMLRTTTVPRPQTGEVLIEVVAAGVNRHDCNQRKAGPLHYSNSVPGLEVSGRVIACGADVPMSRLGEEVVALTNGGGYAEYVTTPAALALARPDKLDWLSSAALPEALFTIWLNFFELMHLSPGESVLIHGGTSGVGSIGIQLLKAMEHDVYATTGSDEKCLVATSFGADSCFRYDDPELKEKVLEATHGRGVDCILDMSGGAHIDQDLAMLATDGRLAFLSAGGGATLKLPLRAIMASRIRLTGALLRVLPTDRKVAIASRLRDTAWPLLGREVRPHIDCCFTLDQAAEAHRHMEQGSHIGKIMLSIRPD